MRMAIIKLMAKCQWLMALLSVLFAREAYADEPFRLQRYDALNVVEVNETSIVFVGNSITNMNEWSEMFGRDRRVLGFGVSGAVSRETLENIESIIIGHPAKVFLMIGTNDLGTYGNNVDIPFENIKSIVWRITTESPKTEVYLESVLPTYGGLASRVPYINKLNSMIKSYVESLGNKRVHYADLFTPLQKDGVLNEYYSKEGLHLFASGYQVWCHTIKDEVGIIPTYPDPNERVLDNMELSGYVGSYLMRVSTFKSLPVHDGDALLIGDDYIHMAEWHDLFHSGKVVNRGSGWGYSSLSVAQLVSALPSILHDNPNPGQVWLCPGYKDAVNKVAPEKFRTDVEAFISVARRCLANSSAGSGQGPSKTRIVLLSCPPSKNVAEDESFMQQYNRAMKDIAEKDGGVDFVDTYSVLKAEYPPKWYGTEGAHPSNGLIEGSFPYITDGRVYGVGYVKMAQTMLDKIREVDPQAYVMSEKAAKDRIERIDARNSLGRWLEKAAMGDNPSSLILPALRPSDEQSSEPNSKLKKRVVSLLRKDAGLGDLEEVLGLLGQIGE